MTRSYNRELFAILTALSLTALLFMSDKVFAETKVKNKIEVNGVEYINEEITTDDSIKTDIDVSVKNNQGSIKYNVNGEEKNIQISPNKNMPQDIKNSNLDEDNKTDLTPTKESDKTQTKVEEKNINEDDKTKGLLETMIKTMDKLFSRIRDLLS